MEQVFFFASHTHSGLVIEDSYPDGKVPPWELETGEKVVATIAAVTKKLSAAAIGVAAGETYIGHNRRLLRPDGTVTMLWRNATKILANPIDPRASVIVWTPWTAARSPSSSTTPATP